MMLLTVSICTKYGHFFQSGMIDRKHWTFETCGHWNNMMKFIVKHNWLHHHVTSLWLYDSPHDFVYLFLLLSCMNILNTILIQSIFFSFFLWFSSTPTMTFFYDVSHKALLRNSKERLVGSVLMITPRRQQLRHQIQRGMPQHKKITITMWMWPLMWLCG